MNTPVVFVIPILALAVHSACAADKLKEDRAVPPNAVAVPEQRLARVRFVPGSAPMKGAADFKGASTTALGPGPRKGELWLQAHADVGDDFPVIDAQGIRRFQIMLKAGDDDHLSLEIRSKEGLNTVDLKRDKAEAVTVGGVRYDLSYPSVSVAAEPHEKPTTNKAMLMVTCRL